MHNCNDESPYVIFIVSILTKCIGCAPIYKFKIIYLAIFGDSILYILQFEMVWQMSFFMPFQKYVVFL